MDLHTQERTFSQLTTLKTNNSKLSNACLVFSSCKKNNMTEM